MILSTYIIHMYTRQGWPDCSWHTRKVLNDLKGSYWWSPEVLEINPLQDGFWDELKSCLKWWLEWNLRDELRNLSREEQQPSLTIVSFLSSASSRQFTCVVKSVHMSTTFVCMPCVGPNWLTLVVLNMKFYYFESTVQLFCRGAKQLPVSFEIIAHTYVSL